MIPSINPFASLAPAQRTGETDRTQELANANQRANDSARRAESAAGIGSTEQDAETSERDADGRRLWEKTSREEPTTDSAPPPSSPPPIVHSKDPTGTRGTLLDLDG